MMKIPVKRQPEIILIDDDADDQQVFSEALKEILPEADFCAITHDNELFAFFETKKVPDLFFLEWSVHCQFERNCLEQIKQQEHLKNVPVIIYSGLDSDSEIKNLYDKGAALFVNKPASYKELTEILQKLLTINWDKFNLEKDKIGLLNEFRAIKIPTNIRV